jgi:hypothetical protein
MFKKEARVMAAVGLIPLVVGIAFAITYPWLKAQGYLGYVAPTMDHPEARDVVLRSLNVGTAPA